MGNTVKTKCYNTVREWPSREAAIEFFTEAMFSCDNGSSEQGRYASIVAQLSEGADYATDENY